MKKRYEGLAGIRGIGALGIISYHMYVLEGFSGTNYWLDRTVGIGGVFVQLFFMLSSFSLMCGYAEKMWRNECDLGQFYKKRFMRIMPVFYFALFLHVLLNYFSGVKESFANIIGSASFLFGLMPSHQESVVMAGWALGIEVVFYLLFPVFLVCTKTKWRTFFILIFSGILYWTYVTFYGVGIEQDYINIIRQMIFFVIGAALYHFSNYLDSLGDKMHLRITVVCYGLLICSFFLWETPLKGNLLVSLSFIILIINQICDKDKLTKSIIFKFLGSISYEMYLFHMIVYRILYYIKLNDILKQEISSKGLRYFMYLFIEIMCTIILSVAFKGICLFVNHEKERVISKLSNVKKDFSIPKK